MQEEKVNLGQNPAPGARPGDFDYEPPVEAIPLPSRGKVYPAGSSLAGATRVEIRAMTATEENILTSRALLKSGKAFTTLMRALLVDKTIDPETMVSGDRNALLIGIRISGYGREYVTDISCPKCEKVFRHEFDLAKMELKTLDEDPMTPGHNLFSCVLPVTKKEVLFKIMTGEDERDMTALQESSAKEFGAKSGEKNVTNRLWFSVLKFGEETDRNRIRRIVERLPARDSLFLRKRIDRVSPGVEMKQTVECPHCGEKSEVQVPLGADFFWPDAG